MSRIMCSVNNCYYWDQGNVCNASEIFITSDQLAQQLPDSYDAPNAATMQVTPAENCMQTACKTFVKKGSQQTNVDGVYRNPY